MLLFCGMPLRRRQPPSSSRRTSTIRWLPPIRPTRPGGHQPPLAHRSVRPSGHPSPRDRSLDPSPPTSRFRRHQQRSSRSPNSRRMTLPRPVHDRPTPFLHHRRPTSGQRQRLSPCPRTLTVSPGCRPHRPRRKASRRTSRSPSLRRFAPASRRPPCRHAHPVRLLPTPRLRLRPCYGQSRRRFPQPLRSARARSHRGRSTTGQPALSGQSSTPPSSLPPSSRRRPQTS